MGCNVRLFWRIFAVLLFLSPSVLVWSMLAGTIPETEVTHGDSPSRRLMAERVKLLELKARERTSSFDEELDLNSVSRGRIPSGPNPVHNRSVRLRFPPARN